MNEEIMGMLSRYEPPLEVEEKDGTFLKMERNQYDLVQCSQSKEIYLTQHRVLVKEGFLDQE